jgi:hypothetical protein
VKKPLRHQDSPDSYRENHKALAIIKLHLAKLSVLGALVAKNGFSEGTHNCN